MSAADRHASATGADGESVRQRVLDQVERSTLCFVENPTPEQFDNIVRMYDGLPPSLFAQPRSTRYFLNPPVWATFAPPGEPALVDEHFGDARRVRLTYSFPADGVPWDALNEPPGINDLGAQLATAFFLGGPTPPTEAESRERGREFMRQVLAGWERVSGVRYREIPDNDAALNFNPATAPTLLTRGHGDVRFGAYAQGDGTGVLAFNYLPQFGGDMTLNSTFFNFETGYFAQIASNYRRFRNTVAHEHGHGLGFLHSLPCNQTKLMEPFDSTSFDQAQADDKRGVQQMYGDRFAGNHSAGAAVDFGVIALASGDMGRSVLETDLSTNGALDPNNTNQDWFRFTLDFAQDVRIRVTPTGGSYPNGPQISMCQTDMQTLVNAVAMGNLNVELYSDDGMGGLNAVAEASSQNAGVAEEIALPGLAIGTYYVRVVDVGPNADPAKPVQLYDLAIRVGPFQAGAIPQFRYSPIADCGIDKLVIKNPAEATVSAQLIGDINSRAQEPGIALRTGQFEWDLDNDGIFEISNSPPPPYPNVPLTPPNLLRQPVARYSQNGVYPVRLKITDDFGSVAMDTIRVTVVGDPISVTGISPAMGTRGTTVPVVITGANLGAVQFEAQVGVLGPGVRVVDPPVVNATGTQLLVALEIAPDAPLGLRDVAVTDWWTSGFLAQVFEVVGVPMPPANDECTGAIALTTGSNDFGKIDATDSADQDLTGTPCAGQGFFNDVWYTFTAPDTGTMTVTANVTSPRGVRPRIAVYSGGACPSNVGRLLGCAFNPASLSVPVLQGETYLVRLGKQTAAEEGVGTITVNLVAIGACCNAMSGDCSVTTAAACTGTNLVYQGSSTVCSPNPCPPPPPTGACCLPDGSCVGGITQVACDGQGGAFSVNMTCGSVNCPQPLGACCSPDGSCMRTMLANCPFGSTWTMFGVCSPNTCPQPPEGACCASDGTCTLTSEFDCGGMFTVGGMCSPNPCPPPIGSCCAPSGSCTPTTEAQCISGTWTMLGTCFPNTCPQPRMGACCDGGGCAVTTELNCSVSGFNPLMSCMPSPCSPPPGACCESGNACTIRADAAACSGTFEGPGTTCSPTPCGPLTGACCAADGTCTVATISLCMGTFQGFGSTCSPTPCPPPTGACCTGTTCTVTRQSLCGTGRWAGPGTTCATPTCCQADADGNGFSLDDLFNFLGAWFAGVPAAEYDGMPGITIGDLFAYVELFVAGC